MPASAPSQPPDPNRLELAADQAIEACGGDAREAVKALIVANEFLEAPGRACFARLRAGASAAPPSEGLVRLMATESGAPWLCLSEHTDFNVS